MKFKHGTMKRTIVELLIERNPNYISENMIWFHLGIYNIQQGEPRDKLFDSTSEILNLLVEEGTIERLEDERKEVGVPLLYYRIQNRETYPIEETLRIGRLELPRLLSCSNPRVMPSEFDEAIKQLGEYANSLEASFHQIVKNEQKDYWAKIVGVFTIFLGVLTVVTGIIPKAVSQIKPTVESDLWGMIKLSLAALTPVMVVFIIAAIVMIYIIRK